MESLKTPPIHSQHLAGQTARIAVAFSGGLDSTVLLHSTIAAHGSEHVIALHIHHGLLDVADAWVEHCARIAEEFDVAMYDLDNFMTYIAEPMAEERKHIGRLVLLFLLLLLVFVMLLNREYWKGIH